MSNDDQAPMIRLEPGGTAPVLSYNVPEPTSYSGRNYIELQIDQSYFKVDPGLEPNGPLETGANAAKAKDAVKLRGEAAPTREYGPAIDEPTFAATSPVLFIPRDPEPGGGGGGGGGGTEVITLTLDSHADGALVRGPHTGAQVVFSGKASSPLNLSKVEVKVGSGVYQLATRSGDSWSFGTLLTSSGTTQTISVLATSTSGKTASRSILVNVVLEAPPDTVDPTLTITAPADGSSHYERPEGVLLPVEGTTSDVGSGVKSVHVSVNGGPWQLATAEQANFSRFSFPLKLMQLGQHRVDVRCTDNAERAVTRSVTVAVASRDTSVPVVAVTAPAPGTLITGPFEGVTVNIEGTASDDSAIAAVELFVNGNPAAVSAVPKNGATLNQWTAPVTFSARGPNIVVVSCKDIYGNRSEQVVRYTVDLIPKVTSRLTRLVLAESYCLSSYLGKYGASRTIKTFSLLPGEKARLSIKTFARTEQDRKDASTILDSYTEDTQTTFEKAMENEQTNKKAFEETRNYEISADAKANWGWGSAGISASASVGTNAAREEFAKAISAATQKHVAKASARRDVQINTTYEVKSTTGEETAIEREIQNVNMSRTLNFVFRQMNQEYITLLHLVDLRVGYFKVIERQGQPAEYIYREVTLPQLYPLLQTVLNVYPGTDTNGQPDPDRYVREIYNQIVFQLMNLYDYQDVHHAFAEWRELKSADGKPQERYLRAKKDYVSTYYDGATGTAIRVPGIIMAANRYVLRTEGVIVEALLGHGDGLDEYSHGLQAQAVRERALANDQRLAEIERLRIANRILEEKDAQAAALYALMTFPPPVAAPAELQPEAVPLALPVAEAAE
jgi:hypothetical protein